MDGHKLSDYQTKVLTVELNKFSNVKKQTKKQQTNNHLSS